MGERNHFKTHIRPQTEWFEVDVGEIFRYKDLIFLFFKRNYVTRYKQTILGPLWLILNPLITVLLYSLVFGNIAGLSTDGAPRLVFYLCSNAIWTFFATSLTQTAGTFTTNAALMGKVYFPRLVMPISSVLTGMIDLVIQVMMLIVIMIGYTLSGNTFRVGPQLLLVFPLVLQTGMLGLGCGIIIAAMTTKYRDLAVLVSFGVQLWMYASPVVYTTSAMPEQYRNIYMFNPMAPIITCWRNVIIGTGELPIGYWGISWVITVLILFAGVILFNRVEKTFMDTV